MRVDGQAAPNSVVWTKMATFLVFEISSSHCSFSVKLGNGLHDESFVDVGNYTTSGNGRLDECVKLFVASDRKL